MGRILQHFMGIHLCAPILSSCRPNLSILYDIIKCFHFIILLIPNVIIHNLAIIHNELSMKVILHHRTRLC